MKSTILALGFGLAALTIVCIPAFAHHGGAAYDPKVTLTLNATITEFKFINPHTLIYFDAPDDKGTIDHWSLETIDPGMLTRQGWTRNTLKPGDHVTIVGHPSKNGAKVMNLTKLVLADGTEMQHKYLN
jgi:hypothetical protein